MQKAMMLFLRTLAALGLVVFLTDPTGAFIGL